MPKLSKKNLTQYSIAFFLFSFPLFFLPGKFLPLGLDSYGKLFFLIFFVSIIYFLFFAFEKEAFLSRSLHLFYPLLLFISFYFLSSLLSQNFSNSFWGGNSPVLPGVAFLFLFLLYLILSQSRLSSRKIFHFLFVTNAIVVFFLFVEYVFHWLGILINYPEIFNFFRKMFGSYEDISVYLALNSVLLAGFLFLKKNQFKTFYQKFFLAIWLLSIFLLVNINYLPAWLIAFFGSLTLVLIERKYFSRNKKSHVISLFFYLSLLFIILSFFVTGHFATLEQREASNLRLNYQDSLAIAKETFFSNIFFGQGAETQSDFFSLERSADLNLGSWWNIRFKQSSSLFIDLFFASGLIGVAAFSYLLFSISFFALSRLQNKNPNNEIIFSALALISSFVATFLFFGNNLLVWFMFFVILSVLERQFFGQEIKSPKALLPKFDCANVQGKKSYITATKITILVFAVFLFAFNLKIFSAEMFFRSSHQSDSLESRIKKLTIASQLNPGEEQYKITLAKILKNQALLIDRSKEEGKQEFEKIINQALTMVRKALEENGPSVAVYETQGMIYRDISQISPDSLELAIQGFEQASILEPTNPVLYTEIGKLYFAKQAYDKAESNFLQAIDLKPNYSEAKFELARASAQLQQYENALKMLADIEGDYNGVELYYEWGKIEFNRGRLDSALQQFNKVLELESQHSNSLYAIALVYEKKGQIQTAIELLEKVQNLNPDNIDIRNKVEKLRRKL